jgi:hypothetical protein
VTRREIFFIVSVACFGIFILIGGYLWRESQLQSQDIELNKQIYARQAEELKKEEEKAKTTPSAPSGNLSTKPAQPASNTAPAPQPAATATPGPPAKKSTAVPPISNSLLTQGYKVGDVVNLGNVEMIVTKSTSKHKVIDITITGNAPGQPPKLVLLENNRIVYEIPADVDINVDVTEKATIEKAPTPSEIK